jgi:subtilisin family serine protease
VNTKYIIIRSPEVADAHRGDTFRSAVAGEGPPRLNIEVAELDARQHALLSEAKDLVAIAPSMSMCLVKPTAQAEAAAVEGSMSWGISAVRADASTMTGEGITVAVLDTGIDREHEAFKGVKIVPRNFTDDKKGDDNIDDEIGHGTHCAGTIFGRSIGGMRIGVAPGVDRALIGKVLGAGGSSSEQIVQAVLWACDEGAQIISMSLGINYPGQVTLLVKQGLPPDVAASRALEGYRANVLLFERLASMMRARNKPALLVAAAGNESRLAENSDWSIAVSPPAVSDGFISVAALKQGDRGLDVAPFSNFGATISAPGVDIVSAKNGSGNGLLAMSGTSMATPHVAGLAALWAEFMMRENGEVPIPQLSARLLASASKKGLRMGIANAAIGAGLVRAPLD